MKDMLQVLVLNGDAYCRVCLPSAHKGLHSVWQSVANLPASVKPQGNITSIHPFSVSAYPHLGCRGNITYWCENNKHKITWEESLPPDWARVEMGSFLAISTRICFWTSGLSSISYLCLSEYDSWNCTNKHTANILCLKLASYLTHFLRQIK